MKKIKLLAATAIFAAAVTSSFAQDSSLGADCGCPPVSSRTEVDLATHSKDTTITFNGVTGTYRIMSKKNTVLTCMNKYILDDQLYVINGQTLTIMPGSVIRGTYTVSPTPPNVLVIARGGKLIADGTAKCPIVMTSTDDNLDGSFPICSQEKWGGLIMLGRAKNNLIAGNTSCATIGGVKVPGVGFVEGFLATNPFNLYGAANGAFDDDDNSGILRYVSVRAAGTEIAPANEINGITLGSVGRGTTIEHVEIVGNADDGIEFFGGTVNVKYVAMWWVNDDMFDWDLGWTGNGQFLFGIQGGTSFRGSYSGSDNGFESDGEDNNIALANSQSHPVIFNATFIGDGKTPDVGGPSGPSAIRAKERGEGEIYNSIFANFKYGLDMNSKVANDAYNNWIDGKWIVVNNDFANIYGGMGAMTVTTSNRAAGSATDLAKFADDGNKVLASIPGFSYPEDLLVCGTPGGISTPFDAQPNPERKGSAAPTTTPPVNGFFKPVSYRGAFGIADGNWLENWSFGVQNEITGGIITGPGDVNRSGEVNSSDLNEVLLNFGVKYSK